MDDAPTSLLAADEPQPVTVTNEDGGSPFVIVGDHAGKYLPRQSPNARPSGKRNASVTSPGISARARSAALSETRSMRWSYARIIPASPSTAIERRVRRRRSSN